MYMKFTSVTNFYFLKQLKKNHNFFVNVRMFGMTNSIWILIVKIEGIEQNQMQDMKK